MKLMVIHDLESLGYLFILGVGDTVCSLDGAHRHFVLWLMPPDGVGGPRGLPLERMLELRLPPVPLLEDLHFFSALP